MSTAHATTIACPRPDDVSYVFSSAQGIGARAAKVAAVIDPAFLAEVGWDPTALVLSLLAEHPLLGRPVCRAPGCSTTAATRARICQSCRGRLAERGLSEAEVELLPARTGRPRRGPRRCVVAGCAREWVSSPTMLCRTHLDQAGALERAVSSAVEK